MSPQTNDKAEGAGALLRLIDPRLPLPWLIGAFDPSGIQR